MTTATTKIRACNEVLRNGAAAYHRKGTNNYKSLNIIVKAGPKGAPRGELLRKGVNTKYISRMLRTSDYLIAKD